MGFNQTICVASVNQHPYLLEGHAKVGKYIFINNKNDLLSSMADIIHTSF